MERDVEKALELVENRIKEHNHDGYESAKINSSSVVVNTFSLKNIRAVGLADTIKVIDEILSKKQDKISGTLGNLLTYNNEGIGELDPKTLAPKDHAHKEYVRFEPTATPKIPIMDNGVLKDSGVKIENIASKADVAQLGTKIEQLNNFNEKIISHEHKNYATKIHGNNDLFVIDKLGNLVSTGITADDIVLKKDIAQLIRVFVAKELESVYAELETKAPVNHSHQPLDLTPYLKKDQLVNEIKNSLK